MGQTSKRRRRLSSVMRHICNVTHKGQHVACQSCYALLGWHLVYITDKLKVFVWPSCLFLQLFHKRSYADNWSWFAQSQPDATKLNSIRTLNRTWSTNSSHEKSPPGRLPFFPDVWCCNSKIGASNIKTSTSILSYDICPHMPILHPHRAISQTVHLWCDVYVSTSLQ